MSIRESYSTTNPSPNIFLFKSIGEKGIIPKAILYQYVQENKYNLAFGDIMNGDLNDSVISNNNDLPKVLATVADSIYKFTDRYPDAIIEIKGVDQKRTRLYNSLFRRKLDEINDNFEVFGILETGDMEIYNPSKRYQQFEIKRKK